MRRLGGVLGLVAMVAAALALTAQAQAPKAANVIVVTMDGLRWQEAFGGAERVLFGKDAEKPESSTPMKRFWRETPEQRRTALLPFLWETVARQGQVFGDPSHDSLAHVANGLWFSYPGYAEMLSGIADQRIDSNNRIPNPNVTVLEWLNSRPGFAGKVAAFGAWDLLPWILNVERSRLPAGDGYPPVPKPTDRPRARDQRPRRRSAADVGRRSVRRADHAGGARVPADEEAARALRDARRDRRMGARGALRPLSRRRVARRPVHPPAVGCRAGDAGLPRANRAPHRGGPRARRDRDRTGPITAGRCRPRSARGSRSWGRASNRSVCGQSVTVTTGQVAATIAALLGEDFHAALPATAPGARTRQANG